MLSIEKEDGKRKYEEFARRDTLALFQIRKVGRTNNTSDSMSLSCPLISVYIHTVVIVVFFGSCAGGVAAQD